MLVMSLGFAFSHPATRHRDREPTTRETHRQGRPRTDIGFPPFRVVLVLIVELLVSTVLCVRYLGLLEGIQSRGPGGDATVRLL